MKVKFSLLVVAVCLLMFILIRRNSLKDDVDPKILEARKRFKHVVVLMLENQSFDKVLGFVEGVGELSGKEYNVNSQGRKIYVKKGADPLRDNLIMDPPHKHKEMLSQLYGPEGRINGQDPEGMGYLITNFPHGNPPGGLDYEQIFMAGYDSEHMQLPAITTLAQNFVVCNRYYASMPGPTGPNRLFVHFATSGGHLSSAYNEDDFRTPEEMLSIFELMDQAGKNLTWKIYHDDSDTILKNQYRDTSGLFHDMPDKMSTAMTIPYVRKNRQNIRSLNEDFFQDIQKNNLAHYSFLTPKILENSQHPGVANMIPGDELVRKVFNALKSREDIWQNTLFIITYDEAGGYFDSVPPKGEVPAPESYVGKSWPPSYGQEFDFKVLGTRVPTILVSPHFTKQKNSTQLEHSSIPKTLSLLWGLKSKKRADGHLSERAKFAHHLFENVSFLPEYREDEVLIPKNTYIN